MPLNGTPNDLVKIPIVTVTKLNGKLETIGTVEIKENMAMAHEMWSMDTMVTPEGLVFLAIPNEAFNRSDDSED